MSRPDQIFDALLVMECQAGKNSAFNLLVKRWHAKLCKQAYWYTRDKEQAKDIAQESWGVILNKIQFLKDPNSFGSWAMRIVTNRSLDWLRKRKRERKGEQTNYDEPALSPDNQELIATAHGGEMISEVIKRLPLKQQQVLNLFYLEEFSLKQISEILDISVGTVKSRLFTARETLKSIIKNRSHET